MAASNILSRGFAMVLLTCCTMASADVGNEQAPDFTLPQLEPPDTSVSLNDYRGYYVLVDFWAT